MAEMVTSLFGGHSSGKRTGSRSLSVRHRRCEARRLAHRSLVERSQYLAARWRQALGDREAMPALDQRPILPGKFLPDRIMLRTLVASDVDDIAIAGSRNHASDRPVIFQHGIGADRRAVQHM